MKKNTPTDIIPFAGAVTLFLGAFNMPYEYYSFLRAFVCLIALYGVKTYFNISKMVVLVYIISLIVFNPFLTGVFDKSTWRIIDIVFGFIFLYLSYVPKEYSD